MLAAVALVAFSSRHALLDRDPRVAPGDLLAALEREQAPLVLDIRTHQEFRAGHVPGAVNVPLQAVASFAASLADKDQPLVLYCETGVRARSARYDLREMGFTHLTQLAGDMGGWRRSGLPVARTGAGG